MYELVAFVDEVLDELGSCQDVEYLLKIAEGGSSVDHQLAVLYETDDLNAVVDNYRDTRVSASVSGVKGCGSHCP